MEIVKHKLFGEGQVIKRDGEYLTVKFNDGSEKRFGIPQSFESGFLTAEGDLKEEVERAMLNKKNNANTIVVADTPNHAKVIDTTKRRARKAVPSIEVVGETATAFESYLIKAGYKIETDDGKPSTVYAYIKAINLVLGEEGLSWPLLKDKISTVITLYDIGGPKENIGNKSNKTVINALRRFQDFTNLK